MVDGGGSLGRNATTGWPGNAQHRRAGDALAQGAADAVPASSLPGGRSLLQKVASLHTCAFDDTLLCGKVTVPLDRFGSGGRMIDVRYVVAPHTGSTATPRGAVFATSGGPGNSITGSNGEMYPFRDFVLPQLTHGYDMVFVDQRGVGRSGALNCPALQHHGYTYKHAAACARKYGAERNMYSTAAVADDLDAIRVDLGFDEIIGMGGSYAGTDMTTYAVRHPGHTAGIVIASPAPPFAKPHQFDDLTPKALPGYVVRACKRSVNCHAAFPRPRALVTWLVHRLRRHPVSGVGYDHEGDRHRVRVTESTLAWNIMLDGDFPFYYAQIPGAAAALRAGDKTPLLRLAATHPIGEGSDAGPARDYSQAANLFRACVDDDNAWDESASPAERRQQYADALAAEADDFGLFSKNAWVRPLPQGFFPSPCIARTWAHRSPWPADAKEDDVPTLILTGDMDNGLSTQISRQVTHVLTDSRLVEVEQAGHNPWFWRSCARQMVRAFIRTGARDDLCAGRAFEKRWEPGGFPRGLGDVPAARPRPGDESTLTDRRLATATVWTLLDAIQHAAPLGDLARSRVARRQDLCRLLVGATDPRRLPAQGSAIHQGRPRHREGLLGLRQRRRWALPHPGTRCGTRHTPRARALVPRQLRSHPGPRHHRRPTHRCPATVLMNSCTADAGPLRQQRAERLPPSRSPQTRPRGKAAYQ